MGEAAQNSRDSPLREVSPSALRTPIQPFLPRSRRRSRHTKYSDGPNIQRDPRSGVRDLPSTSSPSQVLRVRRGSRAWRICCAHRHTRFPHAHARGHTRAAATSTQSPSISIYLSINISLYAPLLLDFCLVCLRLCSISRGSFLPPFICPLASNAQLRRSVGQCSTESGND
jgi:hypothetical protein